MNRLLLRLGLVLLATPVLRAQSGAGVGKVEQYVQTGPTAVAADATAPFEFSALCTAPALLVAPGGQQAQFTEVPADDDYEVNQTFATQALLDAAFPSGTYDIVLQGSTAFTISLTGDAYPAVPQLTNGTWTPDGTLLVDPAQAYTFNLSAFPGYLTTGVSGQVQFSIANAAGTAATDGYFLSSSIPVAITQYPILANTLTPGVTYVGTLAYGTNVTVNATSGGSLLLATYGRTTRFKLRAEAPATTAPTVLTPPSSVTVAVGATATFTVAVTNPSSCTYQWYQGNSLLAGATRATLVIPAAQASNAGSYACVATNSFGAVQSAPATLGVAATGNPGRLTNISCRAAVGTGSNILIAGFAVGGAGTRGTEPLLIRGTGPALAAFGLTGLLADPQLQLFTSGGTAFDDNASWGANSAAVTAADAQVGAFALTNSTSHDAALVENLAGGTYTAQVAGESGDTGTALAEVYDATPAGAYTLSSPRIVNLSARVQVGTGSAIAIAGFTIGGATARTVLIRASGPALSGFGITNGIPDPKLQLIAGATTLAQDIGWAGDPQVASAATSVGAFAWSAVSADSALLVTLPPGGYTAQVSGATGTTGVALIEIYEVP